jgi:hypothetical protein
MRLITVILLSFLSVAVSAQSSIIQKLQRNVPGQGKVTIHQDESITALIGKRAAAHKESVSSRKPVKADNDNDNDNEMEETAAAGARHKDVAKVSTTASGDVTLDGVEEQAPRKIVKVAGYRVQVYAGNNTRNAKLEALRMASDVRNFFPEAAVYTFFSPPRWLCRVGDYRSMEEAYSMMRKLKATRVFHEVSIVKDRVNVSL